MSIASEDGVAPVEMTGEVVDVDDGVAEELVFELVPAVMSALRPWSTRTRARYLWMPFQ
jgi:hypothetical protein